MATKDRVDEVRPLGRIERKKEMTPFTTQTAIPKRFGETFQLVQATPPKPKPLLKKEQTFATSSPTGKTLRTPLLDLKNKPMPSQHVSQPRTEPKNEKTNFATPLMRKPGTSHASRVVIDALNTQQRPPPDRSQLSQVNPSQPCRVVLSDGIYPTGSTSRRTPRRMSNFEF